MKFEIEIEDKLLEDAWKEFTDETNLLLYCAFGDLGSLSLIAKSILKEYGERTGKLQKEKGGEGQYLET